MKKTIGLVLLMLLLISCGQNEIEIISGNYEESISNRENLILEISKPLKNNSLIGIWDKNELLEIKPEIVGRLKWSDKNVLIFHPDQDYLPETKYAVSLKDDILQLVDSTKKVSSDKIYFNTPKFEIVNLTSQWNVSNNSKDVLYLKMRFSYKVNALEIYNNISFKVDGKDIKFNLGRTRVGEDVDFDLYLEDARKYSDKTLEITINKGITVYDSDWMTNNPIKSELKIPSLDDLNLTESLPIIEDNKSIIKLYFSQSIDKELLNDSLIKISPAVEYSTKVTDYGLDITGDFESGKTYELIVHKSMTSIFGRQLKSDYTKMITFTKVEPSISFTDKDMIYLSKSKARNIGLSIVGLDSVKIKITKIYENNLLEFLRRGKRSDYIYSNDDWKYFKEYSTNQYGDIVYEKVLSTKSLSSNGIVKAFDFNINNRIDKNGIYVLTVSSQDMYWVQESQLVALSDIGLIVKKSENDLYIFANSLSKAQNLSGVQASVVSTKNQIEHKAITNSSGLAVIKNYRKKGIVNVDPSLIIAKKGNDVNYLPLRSNFQIEDYEFDTRGTNANNYKAFFYGDRVLYRPGERVNLAGIIRDKKWNNLKSIPIIAKINSPTGSIYKELKLNLNDEGGFETEIEFPPNIVTGTYSANYYLNKDIYLGQYNFKIEEFMPDRLKINATTTKEAYDIGDTVNLLAQVNNLYGTPASNRDYELELYTSKKYISFDKFKDYDFNLDLKNNIPYNSYNKVRGGKTGANGKIELDLQIAEAYQNNGILNTSANLTVFDENGRPVRKSINYDIHTQDIFYGIGNFDYYNDIESNIPIPIIAVDKNQKLKKNTKLRVEIVRYQWNSVLVKNNSGYFRYQSQKEEIVEIDKEITFYDKNTKFNFKAERSGRYEIRIRGIGDINYTSKEFYCYYWGGWNSQSAGNFQVDKEGKILIETEKESYFDNEKCKVLFKTPFDGKLLITLERDGIYFNKYIQVKNKSASLIIDLKEEYVPNVYISAILFKEVDNGALPLTVAYGYKSIKIENKNNKIDLSIIAPEKSESRRTQVVKIKTNRNSKNIRLTLAAVDEGILQITNYKTPNPYDFFYQKYGLDVNSYTMYPFVYPELNLSKSKSGGGEYDKINLEGRTNPLANKRVKLLAKWSGILKTDANGIAEFPLEIPQFSGAVRLMAVAYQGKSFGSAEKEMKIVDPLVVSTSVPRFLSPSDKFKLFVTISNTEDKSTNANVTLKLDSMMRVLGSNTKSIPIEANSEKQVVFEVVAENAIGNSKIIVDVNGHNKRFKNETDITIRPVSSLQKKYGSGKMKPSEEQDINLVSSFIPSINKSKVVISKSPLVGQLNNLSELLKYPYGCVEQTTSKVFPQIYFKDLLEISDDNNNQNAIVVANSNINAAITKLLSMQVYDGGLSYWPGGNKSTKWGTIYAAHFLSEARKAGYKVNQNALDKLFDFLKKQCIEKELISESYYNGAWYKVERYSRNIFYALYVLASNGKFEESTMNLYKGKLDKITEDSKFLLATSYKLAGDSKSYKEIIPDIYKDEKMKRQTGASFASNIRNMAISLLSMIEVDAQNPMVTTLSTNLAKKLKSEDYLSTQDRAFALLALGKLSAKLMNSEADGEIKTNDKMFKLGDKKFIVEKFNGINAKIKSTGDDNLYYFWESSGLTEDGSFTEEDSKIRVSRQYYNREGIVISDNFQQGDLIIIELELELIDKIDQVDNIVITDMLPAGLEIDNPRLSENVSYDWMKADSPEYLDVRDDRINIFTSLTSNKKIQKFYYQCRAVTKGEFNKGVISADAMYDGSYRSYHGGGKVIIN